VTKCTLGQIFHGVPENILLPRNWNTAPFKPRAGESSPSTKLANNSAIHTSQLQRARERLKAIGDRPLSLWQERLQTTRIPSSLRGYSSCSCEPSCFGEDQRSPIIQFCQFFAVHFCCGSPCIRHKRCTKPEPTGKYSWWNSKENKEFILHKFYWVTQKRKMKQATKSKTNRLTSNAFLGPSKRRKRRVWRDPTPSDTPSDSDADLTVPFADDSTEEEEQEDDCLPFTRRFSEDHNGGGWIRCAKCFRWEHILRVGMEEDFVCEPCQG
jgi:hypothetical protein